METAENVIVINGIALTPKIISALDFFQTGGTLCFSGKPRKIDNDGVKTYLGYVTDLRNFIIDRFIDESADLNQLRELLLRISWLEDCFNDFKIPEDLEINL